MRLVPFVAFALVAASPCLAQRADAPRFSHVAHAITPGLLDSTAAPSPFMEAGDSKRDSYAAIGLAAGIVTGLLVDAGRSYFAPVPDVCTSSPCTSRQTELSPPFGTSVLIGAGVGLLVGAFVGSRTYEDTRTGVSFVPANGGAFVFSGHRTF